MIEKFGINIVNVDRFSSKKYFEKKEFYSKIFTDNEINYCIKFKDPYTYFADKFALNEAVITAIHKKISFLNIETFHKNNIPQVELKNEANYSSISSISHENNVAVAVFLIEIYD